MTEIPEQLGYTSEHEWVQIEDGVATIGITAHAAEELGDIVYLELPEAGTSVAAGDACGEIESTKAVSEIYAPVPGEIVAVNELGDAPETVGEDPYGAGWLFKVRIDGDTPDLLDAAAYQALIG